MASSLQTAIERSSSPVPPPPPPSSPCSHMNTEEFEGFTPEKLKLLLRNHIVKIYFNIHDSNEYRQSTDEVKNAQLDSLAGHYDGVLMPMRHLPFEERKQIIAETLENIFSEECKKALELNLPIRGLKKPISRKARAAKKPATTKPSQAKKCSLQSSAPNVEGTTTDSLPAKTTTKKRKPLPSAAPASQTAYEDITEMWSGPVSQKFKSTLHTTDEQTKEMWSGLVPEKLMSTFHTTDDDIKDVRTGAAPKKLKLILPKMSKQPKKIIKLTLTKVAKQSQTTDELVKQVNDAEHVAIPVLSEQVQHPEHHSVSSTLPVEQLQPQSQQQQQATLTEVTHDENNDPATTLITTPTSNASQSPPLPDYATVKAYHPLITHIIETSERVCMSVDDIYKEAKILAPAKLARSKGSGGWKGRIRTSLHRAKFQGPEPRIRRFIRVDQNGQPTTNTGSEYWMLNPNDSSI